MRVVWNILLLAAALGVVSTGSPGSALAAPPRAPTAVVAMGDSYISGEGGRWLGNSDSLLSPYDGTDRACNANGCDPARVYIGGTLANGCHRSDVSEVLSAHLPVAFPINIACSGALIDNVLRRSKGGKSFKGEPPQDDQLLVLAARRDVRMIVLSISGNDFGFAGIAEKCVTGYSTSTDEHAVDKSFCAVGGQATIDERMKTVKHGLRDVIADIRGVMAERGYSRTDYRLVIQTYPAVLPPAARARPDRLFEGCQFSNPDLTWVHNVALPTIDDAIASVAAADGVNVLDVRGLFTGHEICATTTSKVTSTNPPSPTGSEWGRFISFTQGGFTLEPQEALHPNAYGQMALGVCLAKLYLAALGSYSCRGAAGEAPSQVTLGRLAARRSESSSPPDTPVEPARRQAEVREVAIRLDAILRPSL